jgi:hypothetical protein
MDPTDPRKRFEDHALSRYVAAAGSWLREVYRLDLALEAARFLLAPEAARALLPAASPRSGVVLHEEGEDVWLGMYVDPEDRTDPGTILEETSHLLCIAWHAVQERPVSKLVLELQADVDRYAFARLHGGDPHRHLSRVEWLVAEDDPEREHYEVAHDSARRYCGRLSQRYPSRGDIPSLLDELRSFYRAGLDDKLRAGRA